VGKKNYEILKKAQENCSGAYLMKWSAMGQLTKALDDPSSVSKLAELKETMKTAETGTLLCVAGAMGPAVELGADADSLGKL
ncbi:MAG: hypothetical protein ACK5NN_10405, partial [Sphingomonadaceae bacterium]